MSTLSLLLSLVPCATQSDEPAHDPFGGLAEVDWSGWRDLPLLLDDVREHTGVPSLAVAWIRDGEVLASAAAGLTAIGEETEVGSRAAFHLGSVTKSITAFVVGKLVEDGLLSWDTRVGDVLEDLAMHPAYRDVNIEELLQHRGGLHAYTTSRPEGAPEPAPRDDSPTEARRAFVAAALSLAPAVPPHGEVHYSNAGYALAGYLAEVVTGTSFEDLVELTVFEPLSMRGAGFGIPEAPRGHVLRDGEYVAVPRDSYPALVGMAPAGNAHASLEDLGRFLAAHLAGLAGIDGVLRAETVRRLHTAPEGVEYAGGFWLRRGGRRVHWHGGTVGASYAEVRLFPESRAGVVVLAAVEQAVAEPLVQGLVTALSERWLGVAGNFVSDTDSTGIEVVELEAMPEDDERLERVVDELSCALNDEDQDAFRALFAPSYDRASADSMFEFMARDVLPSRGSITSFHAPTPRLPVDGAERAMRMVTFHLQNGMPGYFGLVRDEDERIIELSLFVKSDLCPNGVDPSCDRVARTLDQGMAR